MQQPPNNQPPYQQGPSSPQYPPQYPQYPYPPQQPPQKKKSKAGLIIGILVGVFVLCGVIGAIGNMANSKTTTTTTIQNTTNATTETKSESTKAPANTSGKVGDEIVINGDWTAKVIDVKTAEGNSISKPKEGNTYLVVHVSIKNTSNENKTTSSIICWKLRDENGQAYQQVIYTDAGASPDGDVAAQSPVAGYLVYEVPANLKKFTLQFRPELMAKDMKQWSISY